MSKRQFIGGWLEINQPFFLRLANNGLGEEAYRVLFVILAHLDFENWIKLNQAHLASSIGMRREHFNRALKRLELENIILRDEKVGRSFIFKLNPHFGWKGCPEKHNEAIRKRMQDVEQQMMNDQMNALVENEMNKLMERDIYR